MTLRPLALFLVVAALAACDSESDAPAPGDDAARAAPVAAAAVAAPRKPAGPPDLPGDRPLDTELVCLARAVYFEARGLPAEDLSAVAHVALNRRDDPQFPQSVCAVVKEGSETPPCQFSWWCDGRSDIARHEAEYAAAVKAAWEALNGISADPTKGANMFHNTRVRPGWTRHAEDHGVIGAHHFWRLEER